MKRTIMVEIETDESGKYCDHRLCNYYIQGIGNRRKAQCWLFSKVLEDGAPYADGQSDERRCPACLAAEVKP